MIEPRFMRNTFAALSVLTLASSVALADPPTHPAFAPPDVSRSVYRFDVTITGLDTGGAAPAPATYVLVLEEDHPGSISVNDNVVVMAPGGQSAARTTVGLRLSMSYARHGALAATHAELELSLLGTGTTPSVYQVRLRGDATLAPGATASLGSVVDATRQRRYEVSVTAHRVL